MLLGACGTIANSRFKAGFGRNKQKGYLKLRPKEKKTINSQHNECNRKATAVQEAHIRTH